MDPNATLRPADKMTTEEWHGSRTDRLVKEAVYTALAERLAYLDALSSERDRKEAMYSKLAERLAYLDTKHPCKACDRPICGDDALCPICRAWTTAVTARLTDRVATRKLKVQLVAGELLEFFHQMSAVSELYSHDYYAVSLRPFEDQLWESRSVVAPGAVLRPSTERVKKPTGCFVPGSGEVYWVGCLRDYRGLPVVRCPHEHETQESAEPCTADLVRELYG